MKLILLVFLLIGCNKKKEAPYVVTFDRYGDEINRCSIRDAKGHGPYIPLGEMTKIKCEQLISEYCNQNKYKQIHKTKGYFARGKFGEKITIGTCR